MTKRSRSTARIACLALALVLALGSWPTAFSESLTKASKFALGRSKLTLYVTTVADDPLTTKHTYQFVPSITPAAARERVLSEGLISYISSKPAVVTATQTGELKAHKVGSAVVTCRLLDGSGKKATVKVTVKALPPQSVTLDCGGALTMEKGSRVLIEAGVLPETVMNRGVKYSSSKKSVVSVSAAGELSAKKKGTAVITAKAKAGGKKAKVKVTVLASGGNEGTQYRFYGIANNDYDRLWDPYERRYWNVDLASCKNDLTYMNKAYSLANFDGGKVPRTLKRNLKGGAIRSFLSSIANNSAIDADDVTIFYYTGHGESDGSLLGTNLNVSAACVSVDTVKSYLDRVPGTVIVMLDCCYSGKYIQSKGMAALSARQRYTQTKLGALKFSSTWVSALQKGKPGAGSASALSGKSLIDGAAPRGTYKILTSCAPDQLSWGPSFPNDPRSPTKLGFFTSGLVDGMTISSGRANGDADNDGAVSLQEMYIHSVNTVEELRQKFKDLDPDHEDVAEQTVMVWPQSDPTPVFSVAG